MVISIVKFWNNIFVFKYYEKNINFVFVNDDLKNLFKCFRNVLI